MRGFTLILDKVSNIVKKLIAVLIGTTVVIMAIQVVWRYFLKSPLVWPEQLSRWIFVWATFLGASVVYRQKGHIAVDTLYRMLPIKAKMVLSVLSFLAIGAFSVVFAVYGWQLAMSTRTQVFGSLQLAPTYIYLSAPVSGLLFLLFTIESIISILTAGEVREADLFLGDRMEGHDESTKGGPA